jgi:hypothetical protein
MRNAHLQISKDLIKLIGGVKMNIKNNNELYKTHKIFSELDYYIEFYDCFSFGVLSFLPPGVKVIFNIDTYVYSSMQMSMDSIKQILTLGRINDVYALVRKHYDSVIINIYYTLYIKDNVNQYKIIVDKINDWYLGKEKLPRFNVMKKYIDDSKHVKKLNKIIDFDKRYIAIRENCNNQIHYNSFNTILNNDSRVHDEMRLKLFDQLSSDILNIIILHLSYMFFINDHYMCSSDYIDSLEMGLTPEEDSQYFVAPYIQEFFNKIIKEHRKDIADLILENTSMQLK